MGRTFTFLLIALFAAPVWAVESSSTKPMAQPPQFDPPRVLVQAFKPVASNQDIPWLGSGIQQSLIADLSVGGMLQPTADDDGVKYVIGGTYQVMDGNLRVTGQIFDAETGKVIGGIKATGQLRDLFMLEDTLSRGARQQILSPNSSSSESQNSIATTQGQQNPQAPIVINITNSGPVRGNSTNYDGSSLDRIVQSGTTPSRAYAADYARYQYSGYDSYYYSGYYPYYGYGYGAYWGFPTNIVFGGGSFCRGGFRGGGFHGGNGFCGVGVGHHGGGRGHH